MTLRCDGYISFNDFSQKAFKDASIYLNDDLAYHMLMQCDINGYVSPSDLASDLIYQTDLIFSKNQKNLKSAPYGKAFPAKWLMTCYYTYNISNDCTGIFIKESVGQMTFFKDYSLVLFNMSGAGFWKRYHNDLAKEFGCECLGGYLVKCGFFPFVDRAFDAISKNYQAYDY